MKIKEAVILAGGKSSRMKFDKQELVVAGQRLVEKNISLLKEIFEKVTVVTNRPELYKNLDVSIISDIYPGCGPISGIHSALYHSSNQAVYVCAVDMPNIDLSYIKYIDDIYIPGYDGLIVKRDKKIEPLAAIYNKRLVAIIEDLIIEKKYRPYFLVEKADFIMLDYDEVSKKFPGVFININTAEDLEKLISE